METREKTSVYLLGSYQEEILGSKLPSYRQAFGYLLYLHKVKNQTIRDASSDAIQVVSSFWAKAGIPVRAPQHSIKKLETVFTEWKGLQKHKTRVTPGHKQKENTFLEQLDDLFDIAHSDAVDLITIPEDKAFLLSQRQKGRPGTIGGLDNVYCIRKERVQKRCEQQLKRQRRSQEDMEASTSQLKLVSDSSSTTSDEEDDQHENPTMPLSAIPALPETVAPLLNPQELGGAHGSTSIESMPKVKRARFNIMSPGLASALDRTNISSRKATFVLSEVASSLGHDVGSLNINRNSIHRARAIHRATMASNLKEQFQVTVPLTVHWDGKLMEDLTSKEHVDRLPVLISGVGVEQLLGVPKMPSGTGKAQAAAVVSCLEEWGVKNQVVALCFDTTSSNTGHRSGACTIIEQKLGRDVLYLACRHHVMELIFGAAFEKTLGGTTGPEVLLFKRFKDKWQFMDRSNFQPASTDLSVEASVAASRAEILEFAQQQLRRETPSEANNPSKQKLILRDDYREFVELSIIFLGDVPHRRNHGIRFQAPGAMHHARWMSKAIYALKMWLFRSQFKMTASEERGVRDLATFAVLIYLRAWMMAPLAVEAPLNDFNLMVKLLRYPHAAISTATSKKLGLHLWYVSEELVGLALFDSRVPSESKKLMVAAMEEVAPDHPPKRPRVESDAFLGNRGLEQFCTENSKTLFKLLGISQVFLSKDPSEWETDESYKEALTIVKRFTVINDRAERGVALIQDFNKKLTTGEEQLQFLLQVVSDHRQQFPDSTKKTLMAKTV